MESTAVFKKVTDLLRKRPYEDENENNSEFKKAKIDIFSDRELFYNRVKSFKINAQISSVICPTVFARKGWMYSSNVSEPPIVTCVTCNSSFSVRLQSRRDSGGATMMRDAYNAIDQIRKNQIIANLVSKHLPICPWRNLQSSAVLLETEVYMNAIDAYSVFSIRCQEFMDSSIDHLPLVQCYDQSIMTDELLAHLITEFKVNTNALESHYVRTNVLSTLHGWRVFCTKPEMETMKCMTCNRVLGIWNYLQNKGTSMHSAETSFSSSPAEHDTCAKRMRLTTSSMHPGDIPTVAVNSSSSSSSALHCPSSSSSASASTSNLLLSKCVFGAALIDDDADMCTTSSSSSSGYTATAYAARGGRIAGSREQDGVYDPLTPAKVKRRRSAALASSSGHLNNPNQHQHHVDDVDLDSKGHRVLFGYVPSELPEPIGSRFSFYKDKARNNPLVSMPQIPPNEINTSRKRLHKKITKREIHLQNEHTVWCPWRKGQAFQQFIHLLTPTYNVQLNSDYFASKAIKIITDI